MSNERDSKGRFGKGNRLGRGNPLGGAVAKLRAKLISSVGEKDLAEIVRARIGRARNGDVRAAALLFSYVFGSPVAVDLTEKIEQLEKEVAELGAVI